MPRPDGVGGELHIGVQVLLDGLFAQELEQNREHHLELTLMAGRKGLRKKIAHS